MDPMLFFGLSNNNQSPSQPSSGHSTTNYSISRKSISGFTPLTSRKQGSSIMSQASMIFHHKMEDYLRDISIIVSDINTENCKSLISVMRRTLKVN